MTRSVTPRHSLRRLPASKRQSVAAHLVRTMNYACLLCPATTANRGRICTGCLRRSEQILHRP